jgi:hypothetical protein
MKLKRIPIFQCNECGHKFYTVAAAERASFGSSGCPGCGGADIDIYIPGRFKPRTMRMRATYIQDIKIGDNVLYTDQVGDLRPAQIGYIYDGPKHGICQLYIPDLKMYFDYPISELVTKNSFYGADVSKKRKTTKRATKRKK